MAPKRDKEKSYDKTSSRDRNPFSILESDPQPAPEPSTRQTTPDPETRSTSQASRHSDNLIRIPAKLSTIQSRVLSFKEWPHTNITPQQLAKFGFYHCPDDEDDDLVACFACGIRHCQWDPKWEHYVGELLSLHEENCMWADLLQETQSAMESFENRPITPLRPLTPTLSLIEQSPAQDIGNSADRRSSSPNLSLTSSPRPTYASVLQNPHRSQPPTQPELTPTTKAYRSRSSPTPTATSTPILTVEDLRTRFHNKPSPFKLAGVNQRYTNRDHLSTIATEALSNFLLSALPAFSGFLSDIHKGSYRYLSQDQRFCSRWPTGLHEKNQRQRPTTGP